MRLVALEAVRAGRELAAYFGATTGAKVFHSVVVHVEDHTPVQVEERYVAPSFAPAYLVQDFASVSTTSYLTQVAPATEVENVVLAVRADAATCRLLAVDAREACLRLVRRTWVGEAPATYGVFTYPGSRYSLGSRYKVSATPTR
jgi:GntR family histidine utilization transcriptional repressor